MKSIKKLILSLWNPEIFLKSLCYRIFAAFVVFTISFFVTGKLNISIVIAVIEFVGKIILYYLYELAWRIIRKCY
jgi:uncharacterized membrane protein